MTIKFDKLMCPFVGCYYEAKCNSDSEHSIDDARRKVTDHRSRVHHGAKSLLVSDRDPAWKYGEER